ncbi:cytochrome c [Pseudoroseomonas ludipueritiae]|uniref:C-type cytochrome n=1 Tax=Pseudoroseomonas ludipueritiae TaxID=198093 RepID=A0ABR7R6Z3_9PROT|nr:cytochrome c [Pseudoroseomonas ludipueritiae]MBC9177486.1 c-type cytochrome [Pseudoroseomonas ludipueritiae]
MLAAAVVATGVGAYVLSQPVKAFEDADADRFEHGDAARGQVIFALGDCASCHATPGQGDRLRLGGGMALSSPFGTFRPPNISPDPQDGIGHWRGIDLANALVSGVSPAGQHYYPALPYTSYSRMRPEDVADLWAYLRNLPPVQGRVPPHELPLLFKLRRAIGFWKLLFLEHDPIVEDPSMDAAWNRGHYLVEAVTHCAECHSSRNILNAIKPETRFAGGRDQEGVGFVPNITQARLAGWSREDMVTLLTTGWTPDGRKVASSMADVVVNTASVPREEREAIAAYILSQPPRPTPKP